VLARRQHERLRAVVLDAPAQILSSQPPGGELLQLLVVAVDDKLDVELDINQNGLTGRRLRDLRG
jgi:hypothetical protein